MTHDRPAFVVTLTTTRAEIQHEIRELRRLARIAVIPSTALEYAAEAEALLDPLLAREPEPA